MRFPSGSREIRSVTIRCGKAFLRRAVLILPLAALLPSQSSRADDFEPLCLDGFCIGLPITAPRFEQIAWIVPRKDFAQDPCTGIGCQPEVAFRGYPPAEQVQLAAALSWVFHDTSDALPYNVVTEKISPYCAITITNAILLRAVCGVSDGSLVPTKAFPATI